MLQFFLLLACGTAAGCLFHHFGIPGGYMLGGVAGAIAVKVFFAAGASVPPALHHAIQIGMGICCGAMFSVELLPVLRAQLPLMLLSTAVLLLAGLACAFLVRHTTDMDVISSILATSPGGMNAVVGMAESNGHMPKILAFQMVRLYVVIFMVPVFCWIMKAFYGR